MFGEVFEMQLQEKEFHDVINRYKESVKTPKKDADKRGKKIPYEDLQLDQYKPTAKCVSFKTEQDRILAWIYAIQKRYHDDLANNDIYTISWTDKEGDSGEFTEISVTIIENRSTSDDTDLKLITITIYLTTLVIMIQGNEHIIFAKSEYPSLKQFVNKLMEVQANDSYNDEEETKLKQHARYEVAQGQGRDEHMQKKTVTKGGHSIVDSPKTEAAMEQIANCLTTVKNLDQILVSKLLECNEENVKLRMDLLLKEKEQILDEKKRIEKELVTSKTVIKSMESEGRQSKRSKEHQEENDTLVLQVATLQSELERKTKAMGEQNKMLEDSKKRLSTEIDNLDVRLQKKNEELFSSEQRNKQLQTELHRTQDELLSVKTSMLSEYSAFTEVSSRKQKVLLQSQEHSPSKIPEKIETPTVKLKQSQSQPELLLIGSSIVKGIHAEGIMKGTEMKTTKETAYTVKEAEDVVNMYGGHPKCVTFQIMSNDLKTKEPEECVEEMTGLIDQTRKKFNCQVVVSLPPPRSDTEERQLKTEQYNINMKRAYINNDAVCISDNSTLGQNGHPQQKFYEDDQVHLNEHGTRILASNIRRMVMKTLHIKATPDRGEYRPRPSSNSPRQFNRPPPDGNYNRWYEEDLPQRRRYDRQSSTNYRW